ncbi:MAG: hypothetical protein AAGI10_05895 [Pseudomonadota bacterium]
MQLIVVTSDRSEGLVLYNHLSNHGRCFLAIFCLVLLPGQAAAYIGPGAGLGAIAVALALAAGVLLLIVGLVWYPLKRMMKRKRAAQSKDGSAESE